MKNPYKFLGISSTIFKVLSWVSLVVGVVAGIVIFVGGGTPEAPKYTGFIGILLGVVYLFIFLTSSEIITLLLEIRGKLDKGPSA